MELEFRYNTERYMKLVKVFSGIFIAILIFILLIVLLLYNESIEEVVILLSLLLMADAFFIVVFGLTYLFYKIRRKYIFILIDDLGIKYINKNKEISIEWDEITEIKWFNLPDLDNPKKTTPIPGFYIYSENEKIRVTTEFENLKLIIKTIQEHLHGRVDFRIPIELKWSID